MPAGAYAPGRATQADMSKDRGHTRFDPTLIVG